MNPAAITDTLWTGALEYSLPPELIAQQPAARREDARLMVVDRVRGTLEDRSVAELPALLESSDLLVANDSRVIPARLRARKPSGGRVELLLLPGARERWGRALVKASKPLGAGQPLVLEDGTEVVVSEAGAGGECLIEFGDGGALAAAMRLGRVPLPPYIRRGEEGPSDRERYQTVYARVPGSVAAPTAGLHFSLSMLERIQARSARFRTLTLHVGPGTFTPIRDTPERHVMQAEHVEVGAELVADVEAVRAGGGRVIAVGTTTVRALESSADPQRDGRLRAFAGETELFIRPGHAFAVCDSILTNFHLPRSSLLCLVMAFAGEDLVRYAYEEAVRRRYRFYSYGDAMLIV